MLFRGASLQNFEKIKFHPYKINLVQELNKDDFDRRGILRTHDEKKTDDDPNFFFNIVFLDKATFELNDPLIDITVDSGLTTI